MSDGTTGCRRVAAWGVLSIAAWLGCLSAARAEDVVYLKAPDGARGGQLRGKVVDYTGRELRLQSAAGRERRIPAAQVERVETEHSLEESAGDRLMERGDFRGAIDRYRQALETAREPRDWVRRQILARTIWCQRNLGDWDQAGEYFLILLGSDPSTPDFDCLPLVWIDEPLRPELQRKAEAWLNDEQQPAAVLMGASHLLSTAKRPAALEKLRGLLGSSDPQIAWLAYVQLWRAGANNATPEQQRSFARRIDANDERLRAGAYFVLGQSLAEQQPEEAALALMRLPVQYDREYRLAAAALVAAGSCLERLRRPAQAAGLYREVDERFSQSGEAAQARQRLERLASPSAVHDNEP